MQILVFDGADDSIISSTDADIEYITIGVQKNETSLGKCCECPVTKLRARENN